MEFEKAFFNPENSLYRRAILMHALANGPAWRTWAALGRTQTVPCFYNDIAFLACYQIYRNSSNQKRTIQMRDFMWSRNETDCGFLIDPIHQQSDARKQARQYCVTASQAFSSSGGANGDDMSDNIYKAVYSEMWVPNGSMRAFITQPIDGAIRRLGQNINTVKADTDKSFWLRSLIARFSGTAATSARYGQTFDPQKMGLEGAESGPVMGGTRARSNAVFSIGGHRG